MAVPETRKEQYKLIVQHYKDLYYDEDSNNLLDTIDPDKEDEWFLAHNISAQEFIEIEDFFDALCEWCGVKNIIDHMEHENESDNNNKLSYEEFANKVKAWLTKTLESF